MSRRDQVPRASDGRPGPVRTWLLAAGAVLVSGALLGPVPAGAAEYRPAT